MAIPGSSAQEIPVRFVDVTAEAGISFRHAGGLRERVMPAIVGSGAAFADYDNDGDLDLYIANSARPYPQANAPPPQNVLYQNNGDGTFTDVTAIAGVGDTGWGMGCAFADYDNDGDADLYVTNYKGNVFYRNNGDGTFTDFTVGAGSVDHQSFGAGVAWADYNNDGYVDLYIANYLDYTKVPQGKEVFFPYDFFGGTNVLFLNKKDGRFIDVTGVARVSGGFHLSLGTSFADYDNDGDLDLYVANDADQNILYRNEGDGTFLNTNIPDARSRTGDVRGGMGVTWGDYDNDADLDLFVTNWLDENNILYRNNLDGTFADATARSGCFESGLGKTGWGTEFFDYDNDGDLDLYIACGHIDPATQEPPAQDDILLQNNGDGTFSDVSEILGLDSPRTGRGVAIADYDDDGDLDIFVVNTGERPWLLRNEGGNQNHWLKIRTVGTNSNHDGIGVRVEATTGALVQIREVTCGGSYLSQSSLELEFGFGKATMVDSIVIRWPSGTIQTLKDIEVDQTIIAAEPEE